MELALLAVVAMSSSLQAPRVEPPAAAQLPKLAKPRLIEAGGQPITAVRGHAAPFVADFDEDGKRDLLVGMFGSDLVVVGGTGRFYKNVGTNAAPKYEAFVTLMAKGRPIAMESS